MPEIVSDKKVFTLSEVLKSVQKTLTQRYTTAFWVKAEMNKLNYYQHSGHCYPDLVEKVNGRITAEARAILWNTDYERINQNFLKILREPLKDGIKILFSAKIQFDPKYGLSLKIIDIDPSLTLGDLEREKLETIGRLKKEGLFNQNKMIPVPLVPQRIAVISVETSKGYADFRSVIDHNPFGYRFFYFLFPSLLQGDRAADSLMAQLKRIRRVIHHFDLVAIIRGGGGEVGLTCYNDYHLTKAICQFPIPVLTGIGHSTNTTVTEMVAHTNAITPTKVAENLLQYFIDFDQPVDRARDKIVEFSRQCIAKQKEIFSSTTRLFRSSTSRALSKQKYGIESLVQRLNQHVMLLTLKNKELLKTLTNEMGIHSTHALLFHENRIEMLAQKLFQYTMLTSIKKSDILRTIEDRLTTHVDFYLKDAITQLLSIEKSLSLMNPDNVLKRGFSITLFKDKAIINSGKLRTGDEVKTILSSGSFKSIISHNESK